MKSNYLLLLGIYGILLWTIFDSRLVIAQDDDDDFDDGVVSEELGGSETEAIDYTSPVATPSKYYFAEHFDDPDKFKQKWILSQAKKDGADEQISKYDGEWQVEQPQRLILKGDLGLVLKSKVKHAAIAARLNRPFVFTDKPFIVQYEVTMQEGQECGGSYIKLLSSGKESTDLKQFNDKTPYTIMFGPDKCGNDHKLHFIFRHRNPKNGTLEEKHCKKPTDRLEEPFKDKRPHLYTLIIKPDNSFSVLLDNKEINSGSLLEDFTPSVNPPEEIDDPNDFKPSDWDDRERIADPTSVKPLDWDETAPPQLPDPQAVKPDGWLDDEPEMIPDPTGEKPSDWDVEMDGEWEAPLVENPKCANAPGCGRWSAPLITNPNYKGVWRAPLISNPQYQGKWLPKKIANPHYFKDEKPFKMTTIAAVGIELWSMSQGLLFDNIVITDDEDAAHSWAQQTFYLKVNKLDQDSVSLWGRIMKSLNYKPGWWALYFVYCSIPVSIYVWYLHKRVKEDSVWGWIVKTTDQNPWLWAVYVLIVALLTGLVIFMCCVPSQEKEELEKEAETKKTDSVTEDQPHDPLDEDESNAENEDNEDGSQDEEDNSQSTNNKQGLEPDDQEPLLQQHAAESSGENDGSGDVPRKRKLRKE